MSENLPFDNSPWIIPVHKPAGVTSFDVIRELKPHIFDAFGKGKGRRKLKIGHFGTLDPFAEGVLLLGTGKALKLVQYFQTLMTKTYWGVGTLDFATDTGDCDGQKLRVSDSPSVISLEEIQNLSQGFIGEYHQVPPFFSAVKHEGRPLYEWAREGIFISKDPVERTIVDFKIIESLGNNEFSFECVVTSGTYIRGLWSDLAQKLGQWGHLKKLKRTAWGPFEIDSCLKMPIESLILDDCLRPEKIWKIPEVILSEDQVKLFAQGQYLELEQRIAPYQWVFDQHGKSIGLGVPVYIGREKKLKVDVNFS
ncbi:MAG: tRNA pseudouridine(55) synthase TruB [Bacteriovoracaceae bacterium]|nr:tRNA pseudouridine(55) synthase TruB [Bacteriovoracaceae bacterium]